MKVVLKQVINWRKLEKLNGYRNIEGNRTGEGLGCSGKVGHRRKETEEKENRRIFLQCSTAELFTIYLI